MADGRWKPRVREKPVRDWLPLGAGAVLIVVLGFWAASQFVDPAPPRSLVLSTAEAGGSYMAFAERYRDELARQGVEVQVRTSAGSAQNLERLRSDEAQVALVQGGLGDDDLATDLQSLGSVFLEPLWLFHRKGRTPRTLSDLVGWRLAVGPEGSGTRSLVLRLLGDSGVDADSELLFEFSGAEAAGALRAGRVDAAFFVASASSPVVKSLVRDPELQLMDFVRASAIARLHPYLSTVVLPRGVMDLARDVPEADKRLVAPAANLMVDPELHPALCDLLLDAAFAVHGEPGLFADRDEYPSPRYLAAPLSPQARRYYRDGPPFLQRYLPFWAATLLDRLKVMLLPLIGLLFPLFRIFPPVYRWRIRSRIYRWYDALRRIEPEESQRISVSSQKERLAELDRIEAEVLRVPTPAAYAEGLYDLRVHIELVRRRLRAAAEQRSHERAESGVRDTA